MVYNPDTSYVQGMTNQYAQLLEPQYQRSQAQLAQLLGGRGSLYSSGSANKMQLLQNQKLNQIGQYGQGLMQTQDTRQYEQPFREAALTGQYNGSPTAAYQAWAMPYVTSGNLDSSVLGNVLSGQVRTDRQIDPTWWSAIQGGFGNPYNQAQYYANTDAYKSLYGTPTAGSYPSSGYNYYSPTGV